MTTTSSPAVDPAELLPGDLRVELWKRVERRLRKGEVLITNEQFFKAMAKDFKRMLRVEPDRRVKVELLQMIIQVNEAHPETYLTMGIKNAVKTFIAEAQKGGADEEGTESMQEMMASMVREGRTAMWLEGMGINVDERILTGRFEQTILRIILRMKNLYSGAIDEKDGRNRVQQFLRRRLNNLYPDLSREEKAAIEEAGSHICEGRGPNGEEKGETGRRECIAFDPSP